MGRFINSISIEKGIPNGLTTEDLYAYSRNLLFGYWEDQSNLKALKDTEALAKKLIEIEDNERAYNNYFFILINSKQYRKAFNECKKLLKNEKYETYALKNISNKIFVENGLLKKKKYLEFLRIRLSICESESEKEHLESLIREEIKAESYLGL